VTPLDHAHQHEDSHPGHTVIGDDRGFVCMDCVWTSSGEDKRLGVVNQCRATKMVGPHEWICLNPAHDSPPKPGHGQRSEQWAVGYSPRSLRHHFVRRYPFGDH
jgi:hypothetical protein